MRRIRRSKLDDDHYFLLNQVWNEFFDDFLNPKSEEKDKLPSLLRWRKRLLDLFESSDDLRSGLSKARETVEMKYLEKWRRSAL